MYRVSHTDDGYYTRAKGYYTITETSSGNSALYHIGCPASRINGTDLPLLTVLP